MEKKLPQIFWEFYYTSSGPAKVTFMEGLERDYKASLEEVQAL